MKKLCFLLFLFTNTAFADINTTTATVPVTAEVTTGVDARNMSSVVGSDLSRAVGMAVAPALTTTFSETCMGSTSLGAGFSGGRLSIGSTWQDTACIRRLDAREIKAMGDNQAAKELMCNSEEVRQAFKNVGRPCVIDGGSYASLDGYAKPTIENNKKLEEALYKSAIEKQEEMEN